MRFEIEQNEKHLIFDSDLHGLSVNGVEYVAGRDGVLIYDQVGELQASEVEIQLSTNTSTLIRPTGMPDTIADSSLLPMAYT